MELKLLNDQCQPAATVAAADTIFGRDFNEPLIHQVVVAYQANARSGNPRRKTAPKSGTPPRSPSVKKAPAAPGPV